MKRHLIIGTGNLGLDLALELKLNKQEVFMFPKGTPKHRLTLSEPDVVWCAAGAGGVGGDIEVQNQTHVALPQQILATFPNKTRKIFFSTHYLNNDPEGKLSHYAQTKAKMEDLCSVYKNTLVVRVGSLYGSHAPNKTFPGKILKKLKTGETVTLPRNFVSPTPTQWAAGKLVHTWAYMTDSPLVILTPSDAMPIVTWGKLVHKTVTDGETGRVELGEVDKTYPNFSQGKVSQQAYPIITDGISCEFLWKTYGLDSFKTFYEEL